jgi:hypothetical protein
MGLAAIALSALVYTDQTPYPSWRAAVPVFGAVAVILGGLAYSKSPAIRLLASPPMVWLGLVSYSWYLWHWPLLAFSRVLQFGERNFITDFALGLLSLGLAAATFYFVERPIRRWRQNRAAPLGWRPVLVGIGVCAVISFGGLHTFQAAAARIAKAVASKYLPVRAKPAAFCGLESATAQDCLKLAHGRPIGVLMGDSHAGAARNRIAAFAEKNETLLASFVSPGCMTYSGMKLFIPDPDGLPCKNLEKRASSLQTIKPSYACPMAPLWDTQIRVPAGPRRRQRARRRPRRGLHQWIAQDHCRPAILWGGENSDHRSHAALSSGRARLPLSLGPLRQGSPQGMRLRSVSS